MSAVSGVDPTLVTQCLDLCQALVSQGVAFNFSLTTNSDSTFTFSLDTRGCKEKKESNKPLARKKTSPSTLRRNERRRKEFLQKKTEASAATSETTESDPEKDKEKEVNKEVRVAKGHECNQCEKKFESESGLKIHMGKTHKKENLRSTSETSTLKKSPVKETLREEQCVCCGEVMSLQHQCEEEQIKETHEDEINPTESTTDTDESDHEEEYVDRTASGLDNIGPRGKLAAMRARRLGY